MGSIRNYNAKANKCLMSVDYARQFVEKSKHIKAAAALSHCKEGLSFSQTMESLSAGVLKETSLHGFRKEKP
jgi:hypothetical protein